LKITKKSEYGISALMEIAGSGDKVIRAQDIAERQDIPVKFLEQVLLPLKHRGIIETRRGVGGGYVLNMPAEKITIAEIIRVLDGPIAPVSCISETAHTACLHNENLCALKSVMTEVRFAMLSVLERVTLAGLMERAQGLKAAG